MLGTWHKRQKHPEPVLNKSQRATSFQMENFKLLNSIKLLTKRKPEREREREDDYCISYFWQLVSVIKVIALKEMDDYSYTYFDGQDCK